MSPRLLGILIAAATTLPTGAVRAVWCDAVPWPPPREPTAVAMADSLARAESLATAPPGPAAVAASPSPVHHSSGYRAAVWIAVLDDEVRLGADAIEFEGSRVVFRTGFVGTTILTHTDETGFGRYGVLTLAEAAVVLGAGFGAVALTGESEAGVGPLFVLMPVVALTNHQFGIVLAGVLRRTPCLMLLTENRTDVFVPSQARTWLRWEPGAGAALDLPFGAAREGPRPSLVLQGGLDGRVDWHAGGTTVRQRPNPFAEVRLEFAIGH